jgi:hypothetical protein
MRFRSPIRLYGVSDGRGGRCNCDHWRLIATVEEPLHIENCGLKDRLKGHPPCFWGFSGALGALITQT